MDKQEIIKRFIETVEQERGTIHQDTTWIAAIETLKEVLSEL